MPAPLAVPGGNAPPSAAAELLDLLSSALTSLVGLAFGLYLAVGLLAVLAALLLRARRGPRQLRTGAAGTRPETAG
ncbi:hypothetical protein [Frankia sp. CiP1_Cm_nod2]|uniref:hypothetical protein n=1 Tax=Frankia sp. CiP1_Cm_nod2 TaxID=2897161 RepID=UPI00202581F8